ncbi:hypothetical protein GGR50DRAFT_78665 [Xylaria sp. CBS 124048]|nr:hypothetical protein GGR50DRAFT_78665 [Xylaria sp. CBS 124048]
MFLVTQSARLAESSSASAHQCLPSTYGVRLLRLLRTSFFNTKLIGGQVAAINTSVSCNIVQSSHLHLRGTDNLSTTSSVRLRLSSTLPCWPIRYSASSHSYHSHHSHRRCCAAQVPVHHSIFSRGIQRLRYAVAALSSGPQHSRYLVGYQHTSTYTAVFRSGAEQTDPNCKSCHPGSRSIAAHGLLTKPAFCPTGECRGGLLTSCTTLSASESTEPKLTCHRSLV